MDENLENRADSIGGSNPRFGSYDQLVLLCAALVFLIGILSPPHLMDDVDAVQAEIARNMLDSGDWVTARLDGVAYLEKSPLIYWMMAASYRVFGVHDWSARLPIALATILLCWLVYQVGRWSFGSHAGLYAGIALSTCAGLFLFTRILIPDSTLTLTITLALWAVLRLQESGEQRPKPWACLLGLSLGAGLLLKGLIAIVFPAGAVLVYLAVTRELFRVRTWKRMHLGVVIPVMLLIAVPWHVMAMLRNPPLFAFSMHSGPGQYRGFFWFYFFNEHLLRFLNLRYPRDYNTVPRALFWLLNLVWLFPWSVYLPAAARLDYSRESRAGRTRLMCLCWAGFVMVFFTFSTTQEYYSMPIYPALALLLGSALAEGNSLVKYGRIALAALAAILSLALFIILFLVRGQHPTGDISQALTQNSDLYTLSMGHIADLTLAAFAFLRLPVALAGIAFTIMAIASSFRRWSIQRTTMVCAAGMILFIQAARVALVRFDNYLGSYPLAAKLLQAPPGRLIEGDAYYAFSSVFFYTNRTALLWNGRMNNLEYGSYAPDAPKVFIDDETLVNVWRSADRHYLLIYGADLPAAEKLLGKQSITTVAQNAGNYLLTNQPLP